MVCCNKMGKLTSLVPTWVGANHWSAPEVADLFFANWVWYYSIQSSLFMVVMFILLHHSGVPCGPCSECKHCLIVLTIPRLMVRQNIRTAPLSRLYELLFMRVLMIGWRLFHSLNCVWTMQWRTPLKCRLLPLRMVSHCEHQWTTWTDCTPTKRHKPLSKRSIDCLSRFSIDW